MPISRLVADNFNRPWSLAIKMFDNIGRVLREGTARPTTEIPRTRSCCVHEAFIGNLSPSKNVHILGQASTVSAHADGDRKLTITPGSELSLGFLWCPLEPAPGTR